MNLLEELLEREEGRLKRIDENPDDTRLQSNRLGFELELDLYRELLEAWQNGKPLLPYFPSASLARALGSQSVVYEGLVPNFPKEAPRYTQAARNMGLPEYICDAFTLANVASMLGELPPPSIGAVCSGGTCRVWPYHLKALAEHFAVPTFEIDTPHEYTEDNVMYLAMQLGELVKFVESEVPGLKYDRERHIELIEVNRIFVDYCRKEWEMRKHVPFPLDSIDSFRQPFHREPNVFKDTAKALEYWRLRVEEIEERVNRGISKEENLRLLWVWGGPVYLNPIAQLEPRGISVPAVILTPTPLYNGRVANWGDEKEFGRKLSPLEEEARFLISTGICRRGRGWVDEVLWACRDLGCDGIIYYQLKGCVHIGTLARLVADAALKEQGVHTLVITGRLMDPSSLSPEDFESRLVEFVNMVLHEKKS
jgi:benzoyl-CoA reductase/2-hydroxyglutaryl-CoA dehydratase subunit BcrC/BadD/HgdB